MTPGIDRDLAAPHCSTHKLATSTDKDNSRTDMDLTAGPRTMMTNSGTVNTETAQRIMRKEPDNVMVSGWCKKSFRSVRGLRIHQTRKACRRMAGGATNPNQVMQRTEVVHTVECNAEDDIYPFNTHGVIDESTAEHPDVRRPPIDWPAMSEAEKWSAMDEDICWVLSNSLKGDSTKKLQHLADTIYHNAVENWAPRIKVNLLVVPLVEDITLCFICIQRISIYMFMSENSVIMLKN